MATPIANAAAGHIAIQATLTVLIHTIIGLADDQDEGRREILEGISGLIDGSAIPDLPSADQKAARDMAKTLVKGWVMGGVAQLSD